jgi:hypothetical protein
MDTSPSYMKMCEKASEIKVYWKPDFGDFYISLAGGISSESQPITSELELGLPYMNQIKAVWLPRQDQLQEIISDQYTEPWDLAVEFANALMGDDSDYFNRFLSMEQLWLAYVMNQKFNKRWNGRDWVLLLPLGMNGSSA